MGMRSRAIVFASLLVVAMVTGGWLLQGGLAGRLGIRAPWRMGARDVVDGATLFRQVAAHVRRDYVDSIGDDSLYRKAVDGLLVELHDPHSAYLSRDRVTRLDESTGGTYAGIGVLFDVRDGYPVVVAALHGTPAERAGMRTGDQVVSMDGKSTRGWTGDEAVKAMRGPPLSSVSLVVERVGSDAPVPYTLQREDIHVHSVQRATLLRPGVGYVFLSVFSETTVQDLMETLDSLARKGMRSAVIDLRGNPGGLLDAGVGVSDLFLDEGQEIVSMRARSHDADAEYKDRAPSHYPDLPLVLLVNEGTASAAEIVAGALQDHDRALIVGRTSYGKGSAQNLFRLPQGGALKLTTARWFTPSGRSINRSAADTDDVATRAPRGAAPARPGRPRYRTDGGRLVYGGGGITPDVVLRDSQPAAAEIAWLRALGAKVPQYRDALTSFALALKASGTLTAPEFEVTPAMRDSVWARMRARGIQADRALFDAASPAVSRSLELDVARYVFGPDAEFRRVARDDRVLQAALDLAAGARSQARLLALGAKVATAARADSTTPP
jgi:carboxyl-terminal processing protease